VKRFYRCSHDIEDTERITRYPELGPDFLFGGVVGPKSYGRSGLVTLAFFPRPGVSRIYGVGTHPMAAVPILPKCSRPFVSVTLVTGP
jgi:hypothetical protein